MKSPDEFINEKNNLNKNYQIYLSLLWNKYDPYINSDTVKKNVEKYFIFKAINPLIKN